MNKSGWMDVYTIAGNWKIEMRLSEKKWRDPSTGSG